MKRIAFFAIGMLFACNILQAQVNRTQPPKPAKAQKIQLGDYQKFKMDNGLTVILVENHELPTVTFSLQMAVDPFVEGNVTGTASFAGTLLRTGTTTRTKAQLDKEIDFIGASINTSASSIEGSSLKKHQDKVLELMSDILYNPVFPQDEFDKLKKQTLSALSMASSDPSSIVSVVSKVLRYGKNHPYGEPTTETTVGNLTLDGVKAYYKSYFTPTIGYLIMIGDLRLAEAIVLAQKYFSAWKPVPVTFPKFDDPASFKGNRVAFVDKPGAVQSVIAVTSTVKLKHGDADALPAEVMNNILGGGVFSGRLMMNLREDKAYTYGARSSLNSDQLIGFFNAGAQVRNPVTDSAITQFLYEMKRMRDEPVSEEDLRLTKNVMAGEFGRALESPSTLASFALSTARFNLPADLYATYLERLEKVTVADVQAMTKKYLHPDNCILLVVGNKNEVADKLKGFAESGNVEFYDWYGNPLSDAPVALPEGLTATNVIDLYIQAAGGKQKLSEIKQITTKSTGSMDAGGRKLELAMESVQMVPDKSFQVIKMGSMLISKQVCNEKEGWMESMAGKQEFKDKDLATMKDAARICPELFYFTDGFKTTLDGIETIGGDMAYRINVVYPSGTADVEYYSVKSGLKIRRISKSENDGQMVESITDYGDYREINGIKFPFSLKEQAGGQVIDIKVDLIDLETIPDLKLFKR